MSLSVLIVDDSDIIRRMIARTLEMAQIPVATLHEASNGRQALAILDREWVDVVLVDLNMPVMGGLELLRRMRADDGMRQIPAIVVSTESCDDRIAELTAAGVRAVVRKPFTPEQIRDALEGLIAIEQDVVDYSTLLRAMDLVLPTVAFMNPEPTTAGRVPSVDDIMYARMGFSGAVSGVMTAHVPRALARAMAANMLGSETEDSGTAAGDAVGEILNTLAGIALTEISDGAVFDLAPPEVTRADRDQWDEACSAAGAAAFIVEGLPMLLSLHVRAHPAQEGHGA